MPITFEDLDPLEFMIEAERSNLAAHVIKVKPMYHSQMVYNALQDERRALASLLLLKTEVDYLFR